MLKRLSGKVIDMFNLKDDKVIKLSKRNPVKALTLYFLNEKRKLTVYVHKHFIFFLVFTFINS